MAGKMQLRSEQTDNCANDLLADSTTPSARLQIQASGIDNIRKVGA